ncbi:MAG: type II toxin-antitoxin system HicA family toxin [Acidimicrobiales bacterium]
MGGRNRGTDSPKLLSQATAITWLESLGWTKERGGSHVVKMTKPGCRPITLPAHKGADYGKGLKATIVRQAGCAQIEGGG